MQEKTIVFKPVLLIKSVNKWYIDLKTVKRYNNQHFASNLSVYNKILNLDDLIFPNYPHFSKRSTNICAMLGPL